MDKMKALLADSENQLKSSDTGGSIAWAKDDVFAKVMGKERKGHVREVGFGPTPGGQSSTSALTDSQTQSTQARNDKIAILNQKLATMKEKIACFDQMKEKHSQFEEMEQRMSSMF